MSKTPAQDLAGRMLAFILRHSLTEAGETLVVAVSGGPDSVCLLHLLRELRTELGLRLHVAHLDHQLRGAESQADARYVAELAQHLELPATVEARDVAGYRLQHRLGLEAAARQVRYEFLADVARSVGSRRVAVGHTADDQAETILMHLVRGAGGSGLRGMQPQTLWSGLAVPLVVVRPLLAVRRREIEAYLQAQGLKPRIDPTNLELPPLRNRIRHQLIPLLSEFNPSLVEALLRTARALTDDLDFIASQVARHWSQVVKEVPGGWALNRSQLSQIHPSLRRHLLRRALETVAGEPHDVEAIHIEQMMALLHKPAGSRLHLPRGLALYADYDRLLLGDDPERFSPLPPLTGEYRLQVPGVTQLAGWQVVARLVPPGTSPQLQENLAAELDFGIVGTELIVRGRRPGERFQPLGMAQPKKLQDFLVNEKVPRLWRERVPLVASPRGVVWVVGHRIAHWARVTEATRQVLRLEFSIVKTGAWLH
ncbi:MAG: tRNA lysidine(34) synthetase TilS [Chloroflexi bacterium]|nr:tRNA lysidine(34) synthetase TilS [Chloroflexota bacterium]